MAFWLPASAKKGIWIAFLLLLLLLAGRYIVYPLLQYAGYFRDLTEHRLAEKLSERIPELQDKLINFLELETIDDAGNELLRAELDRRSRELNRFNFKDYLPGKTYLRYVYLLFVPLFLIASLKITGKYGDFTQSFDRLTAYNKTFRPPAPYKLHILSPLQTKSDSVYVLRVAVSGNVLPSKLAIRLDGEDFIMNKDNDTVFSWNFQYVTKPVDFQINDGKYFFGPYHLSLLSVPVIKTFDWHLHYPRYLSKKDTVVHSSFIRVPEGTRIDALLQLQYTDSIRLAPDKIPVSFYDQQARFSLTADKNLALSCLLTNAVHGLTNRYRFDIRVIPDLKPDISVTLKKDSSVVHRKHFLLVHAKDDHALSRLVLIYRTGNHTNKIPVSRIYRPEFRSAYVFPMDFRLPDTLSYTYFFRIYDNKTPQANYTDSPVFTYEPAIKNKRQFKELQQKTLAQFQGNSRAFEKQTKEIDKIVNRLKSEKEQDYYLKQQVNNVLSDHRKENRRLRQLLRNMKQMMNIYKTDSSGMKKLNQIKQRLDELQKSLQNDSLARQLQNLLKQMQKEKMLDKLKEMQSKSDMQEKSLKRLLELTKRFFIEESLKQLGDTLNRLAKQQDSLSRLSNAREKAKQKQLLSKTGELLRKLDTLRQLNNTLSRPVNMPDTKPDLKAAEMFQRQSLEQIPQSPQKANSSQRKAAQSLRQAAMSLQALQSASQEMKKEDLNKIKILIYNLLQISFQEENFLNRDLSNEFVFSRTMSDQAALRAVLEQADDTLYAIASRQPAISQDMFDALSKAEFHSLQSAKYLQDRNFNLFSMHQHALFESVNTLIYLLNLFLDSQSSSLSKGQGQGSKGGMQLSDKIKKRSKKLGKSMQQMLEAMKGRKKGRKNGQQKQSQGNRNPKGVYSLYKEQQQLKDMLEKMSARKVDPKIRQLNRELESLSKKLLREGLNPRLYDEFMQWQYRLLQYLQSVYKQEQENKRESRTARQSYQIPDSVRLQLIKQYFPHIEEIKYFNLPLQDYYDRIYKNYQQNLK